MKQVTTASATATARTVAPARKYQNEALFGSGWQNDGVRFINLTRDRNLTEAEFMAIMSSWYRGEKQISLQPVKNVSAKAPARKYVMVLRAPMQG
jgi:hypothetical protein